MKDVKVTRSIRPDHKDIGGVQKVFGDSLVKVRYYLNTATGERWKTVELLWEDQWKDMSTSCQMNPTKMESTK